MTKLLLIAFLLALKTNCVVSAARTRVRNLSVGNGKATKAANPFPKLTKRQKAGREIDRSFLVDLLDPDSNHHDYFSMSMAFTEASSPSPSPEPSPAPTPSPTGGPSQATATDHPSSAPSQETDEPSFGPTQDDAICYCAPNTYEFTLDFALTCPGAISTGGGVQDFSCFISPFANSEVTDLVPVAIQSINVIELDQNLQLLAQESIERDFGDGDTFQYTSVAAFPGTTSYTEDAPTNIPRAIQLNINGINQNGEGIINVFIIVFTNSCDVYPVLFEGESIGWTTFTNLGAPGQEFCPLAPAPTESPTPAPTASPSTEPTEFPSQGPTLFPSSGPTGPPSSGPSQSPSNNPSVSPSNEPSASPTLLPSATPSISAAPTCGKGKGGCTPKSTKAPLADSNRGKGRTKRHLVGGN